MKTLLTQLLKFGIVGILATIVDFIFYTLLLYWHVYYLVAAFVAFLLATVVNYYLSMNYVFSSTIKNKTHETSLFLISCVLGLLLTLGLMSGFDTFFQFNPILNKLLTTVIVMGFNFITRKYLFERK